MSSYTYATIDPRPVAREAALADLAAIPSFGLEVTVEELANACSLGNVDPQHLGGDTTTAAIEVAVTVELPPAGARLVTLRPDADAFGSMAVLAIRADGVELDEEVLTRVALIAEHDKGHHEWSPMSGDYSATTFDGLKAEVMNFRLSAEERVALVREWLLTGDFAGSEAAVARVERERWETVDLLDEVQTSPTGKVAVITTASRFGVSAAYTQAGVVVAVNEEFSFNGGPVHRKVTVCQSRPGLVDLKGVFATLSEVEPGWGGSPTIGGSPQGESSVIATDEIVRVVEEHLLG